MTGEIFFSNVSKDSILSIMLDGYGLMPEDIHVKHYTNSGIYGVVVDSERSFPGRCYLTISDDNMIVYLSIVPPINSSEFVSLEDIYREFSEKKIVSYIREHLAEQLIILQMDGYASINIPCAEGVYPIQGEDAKFVFEFSITDKRPKIDKSGVYSSFDQFSTFIKVKQGQKLLTKIPAGQGRKGVDVFGEYVDTFPGEDKFVTHNDGVNVINIANGATSYYANRDGCFDFDIARAIVRVDDIFEYDEVRSNDGDIDVKGIVYIKGDVFAGSVIRATGSVFIEGNVSSSKVYAGGDIMVRLGIIGSKENNFSELHAGGSIVVSYVENAKLHAKNNIEILRNSFHSYLQAGNNVFTMRSDSIIAGGSVEFYDKMDVQQLGRQGTKTHVTAGRSFVYADEIKHLKAQIVKIQELIKTVEDALKDVNTNDPELANNSTIVDLLDAKYEMLNLRSACRLKIESLMMILRNSVAIVNVRGSIQQDTKFKFFGVNSPIELEIIEPKTYIGLRYDRSTDAIVKRRYIPYQKTKRF